MGVTWWWVRGCAMERNQEEEEQEMEGEVTEQEENLDREATSTVACHWGSVRPVPFPAQTIG